MRLGKNPTGEKTTTGKLKMNNSQAQTRSGEFQALTGQRGETTFNTQGIHRIP